MVESFERWGEPRSSLKKYNKIKNEISIWYKEWSEPRSNFIKGNKNDKNKWASIKVSTI